MTDADQFEAFVRRYQDMVFATAVRLLGNPVEAEDVSQTVFLRAFQQFDAIGSSPTSIESSESLIRGGVSSKYDQFIWENLALKEWLREIRIEKLLRSQRRRIESKLLKFRGDKSQVGASS